MNTLPKELEDIIMDYKNQLKHSDNFKKCLKEINNIQYTLGIIDTIDIGIYSRRFYKNKWHDYQIEKLENGNGYIFYVNEEEFRFYY